MTPFVGRSEELEALRRALGSSRLVTVCGPAGIGKTRLVRHALLDEPAVCDLSTCTTETEIAFAIATELGVEPEGLAHALDRLSRGLVLDAADRAAPALRILLSRWLAHSPRARFVVTLRAPLGLGEEHELPLGPLALTDAVELYTRIARSLGHSKRSPAAERIVERLDRHPLAIEWFTPKALVLGETAALARLEDRRFDESPLAASLDESFETLDYALLSALERIAAFERGVPLEALDRVLEDPRALDRLVERGLVRIEDSNGTRAMAHGPVAERAMQLSERAGRAEATKRIHARVVLETPGDAVAERVELEAIRRRFFDRDPELAACAAVRLAPIEIELDAERSIALLEALLERTREAAGAVRVALGGLERHRGRLARSRSHLVGALEIAGGHRFDALIELAHVDRQESKLEEAQRGYERALAEATDERSRAIALGEIGRVLQSLGRFRTARDHHVRAIAIVHGDRAREALERSLHARATHRAGAIREAIVLHERALAMHRELGSRRLAAAELGHLGFCHHEIGEVERAEELFRQSVDGLAEVGDVALEAIERTLLARCLADQDRFAEARLELAIAEKTTARLGIARLELTRRFVSGLVSFGESRIADAIAEYRAAFELGLLHEVGFEALLPAHLALAETGGPSAALIESSERAIASIDNPGLVAAHAILAAGALATEPPAVAADLVASSSDVRRALRHVAKLAPRAALALARDGRLFVLPNGTRIELGRRAAPRRVLLLLFETRLRDPGRALDQDELIAAGWPNERMRHEAAQKRLRTAIWTLRGFGLEDILLTRDEGYLLDPFVPARWLE